MAIKASVGESIKLDEHICTHIQFISSTPDDSNSRATDMANTLILEGKVNTADADDQTKELAIWANKRAEDPDCYKNVVGEVQGGGGKTVREYTLPQAFVVDYKEHFDDETGVGHFRIVMRQKKDKIKETKIEGNFMKGA